MVDQLANSRVFQIHFGGGEPFTYPGFMELLRHAQQRGFCCQCISTNGALLDQQKIAELEEIGGIYLQLSLDGATEGTCDALRGKGAYKRAMDALRRLRGSTIIRTINFVYCRDNAHQLDEMLELARQEGATLRVTRLKPSGRGRDVYQKQRPTQTQFQTLHQWLNEREGQGVNGAKEVLTGDTFFHLNALGGNGLGGFQFCGAGKMTCLITPNGDVFPCAFTQEDSFRAGNLRNTGFETIWRDSPVFHSMFRGADPGACGDCDAYGVCGGGCPAVKHPLTGRLDVPDPDCVLKPAWGPPSKPLCAAD